MGDECRVITSYLSIYHINGLTPLLFHDPMLDYSFKVTDHRCIVEVHVRTTMALNQLVDRLGIQVGLKARSISKCMLPGEYALSNLVSLEEMP